MTAIFIAGPYTATYNAKALGQSAEGWRISQQVFKRDITGDAEGDTVQDAIFRGRDIHVSFRLIEAISAGINDLLYPYDGPGTVHTQGQVGILDIENTGGVSAAIALPLVFTAIAGTPAANDGAATITFAQAIMADNFPVEQVYTSDLLEVPIRVRVYMVVATGVFGTET